MKHIGNLTITSANAGDYAGLTDVTGYLEIHAKSSLPVLATVGGYLTIRAKPSLPVLTTVGESLSIQAEVALPMLVTVGGYLTIHAEAALPMLVTVGGSLTIQAKSSLPVLTSAHGVPGNLIAISDYGLWAGSNGLYYAGCRKGFTREQALKHWDREDDRACLYTLAIGATS